MKKCLLAHAVLMLVICAILTACGAESKNAILVEALPIEREEAILFVGEKLEAMRLAWELEQEQEAARLRIDYIPTTMPYTEAQAFRLSRLRDDVSGASLADMLDDDIGWLVIKGSGGYRISRGVIVTLNTEGELEGSISNELGFAAFDEYLEYYLRYGTLYCLRVVNNRRNSILLINGDYDVIEISPFTTNSWRFPGGRFILDNLLMRGDIVAEIIRDGRCLSIYWQYRGRIEPRQPLEISRPLEIYQPVDGLITMEVAERSSDCHNLLTVIIRNNRSGYDVMIGEPFEVEFFDGENWRAVPGHNTFFHLMGLMVHGSREMQKDIDNFPHSEPGLYRIRKDVQVGIGAFGTGVGHRHEIVAEFYRL